MWKWIQRQASPKVFYETCNRLIPWFFWSFISLLILGLYWSLVISPADYQQGDGYRIIFIHVPSAILSMLVYAVMAIAGGIGLIWQIKMAEVVAKVSAPIGAGFTIIAPVAKAIIVNPAPIGAETFATTSAILICQISPIPPAIAMTAYTIIESMALGT